MVNKDFQNSMEQSVKGQSAGRYEVVRVIYELKYEWKKCGWKSDEVMMDGEKKAAKTLLEAKHECKMTDGLFV